MSRAVVVRYRTRAEAAEHNHELIHRVFDELHSVRPRGLRYLVFRLEDGLEFLHMAVFEGDEDPLSKSAAFHRFQDGISERLQGPPEFKSMNVIGSYGVQEW